MESLRFDVEGALCALDCRGQSLGSGHRRNEVESRGEVVPILIGVRTREELINGNPCLIDELLTGEFIEGHANDLAARNESGQGQVE